MNTISASILVYIILVLACLALTILSDKKHKMLLAISSIFMGCAIVTAMFHSDIENARFLIVGLNSIGIMTFYFRHRFIRKLEE